MNGNTYSIKVTEYVGVELRQMADNKEKELRQAADQLAERMNRLVMNLAKGESFNNLGEVQGLGAEVDRLTGELALLHKLMNRMPGLLKEAQMMTEIMS